MLGWRSNKLAPKTSSFYFLYYGRSYLAFSIWRWRRARAPWRKAVFARNSVLQLRRYGRQRLASFPIVGVTSNEGSGLMSAPYVAPPPYPPPKATTISFHRARTSGENTRRHKHGLFFPKECSVSELEENPSPSTHAFLSSWTRHRGWEAHFRGRFFPDEKFPNALEELHCAAKRKDGFFFVSFGR